MYHAIGDIGEFGLDPAQRPGEPYNVSMLKSRLVPWLGFGAALVAASMLWHGGERSPADKPAADHGALAAGADVDPTRLIVDFRDDVSASTLANNGFEEIPISDYSARDRLYRLDFASAGEAAAARAKLASDPSVESVDFDAMASIPPGEEVRFDQALAAATGAMEAECSAAPAPGSGFPNDACFKYQWHMRQLGMPDAWKRGTGKGVIVAVIDTGVSKVGDLADTNFVAGYNFLSNNANADDDHGHGTHVAGTIAQSTNNKIGVAGVAYGASIMPLKVLTRARLGLGRRHLAGHPLGRRPRRQRHQHEPGRTVADRHHGQRRQVRPRKGRRRHRGGGQRRAREGRLSGAPTRASSRSRPRSSTRPRRSIRTGARRSTSRRRAATRASTRTATASPTASCSTRSSRATSGSDYLWFMGTSMASPHAAGVAALIVGAGIRKPDAVEEILLGTARKPKGNAGKSARVDDHYGAGIVDAGAALSKAKDGKGAGELGLAGAMALLGIVLMRRRGAGIEKLGPGFVAALLVGSSGLFFLPALIPNGWAHGQAVASALSSGFADSVTGALGASFYGSPLLYSADRPAGPDRAALRRAQAAAGAGRLRLRRRGRAAVRRREPRRRRPLRAELPGSDLAGRPRGASPACSRRRSSARTSQAPGARSEGVASGGLPSPRPSPQRERAVAGL